MHTLSSYSVPSSCFHHRPLLSLDMYVRTTDSDSLLASATSQNERYQVATYVATSSYEAMYVAAIGVGEVVYVLVYPQVGRQFVILIETSKGPQTCCCLSVTGRPISNFFACFC